jgi:hypothetical protein
MGVFKRKKKREPWRPARQCRCETDGSKRIRRKAYVDGFVFSEREKKRRRGRQGRCPRVVEG